MSASQAGNFVWSKSLADLFYCRLLVGQQDYVQPRAGHLLAPRSNCTKINLVWGRWLPCFRAYAYWPNASATMSFLSFVLLHSVLLAHSKQIRLMTASANISIRVCVKIRRIIRYLIKTVVTVIVLSNSCAKDSEHESAGQAAVATGRGVVCG